MNNMLIKGIVTLGLAFGLTYSASAQQVNENELKINVTKIANSTQQLKNLEPVAFQYNTQKFKNLELPAGNQYGFLASNVETVFPDMIQTSSKVYHASKNSSKVAKYAEVDQESLIPVLVAAIKEQQEQIEALRKEVAELRQTKLSE
ncbi:tail fiber domain-containing protein [Sphingobacterium suaedae]|uniref:Tail fiber domain-containing protein n=1 Tax=Sphingobacterium suaedae TaxID=1686402 RepID=A0ABW5KHH6_9SPHI